MTDTLESRCLAYLIPLDARADAHRLVDFVRSELATQFQAANESPLDLPDVDTRDSEQSVAEPLLPGTRVRIKRGGEVVHVRSWLSGLGYVLKLADGGVDYYYTAEELDVADLPDAETPVCRNHVSDCSFNRESGHATRAVIPEPEPEPTHVDDFIDGYQRRTDPEVYARWFFALHRFPASLKTDFDRFISPFKLFCDWQGKRWRVTGASLMGDVWLASDFARDTGYDERVAVDECSGWGEKP